MKCPKCGKEIDNDNQFCEYCGAKISLLSVMYQEKLNSRKDDCNIVMSSFVVILMFFIIGYSMVAMGNMVDLRRWRSDFMSEIVDQFYKPAFLHVFIVNICMFVISIILAIKNKIRKSTTIALCVLSAIICTGSFCEYMWSRIDSWGYIWSHFLTVKSLETAAIWISMYIVYLLIAKWKNIKF